MQPDEVRLIKSHLKARASDSPILFPSRNNLPISRQRLDELMKEYGRLAGVDAGKLRFHALKHLIATHLLDARAELRFVQDWLGHANIQNTVVYTFLSSTSRQEKARQVFLKLPSF